MAGGSWTLYFMWMVMVTNQNWASFIFISVSANTKIFNIYLCLNRHKTMLNKKKHKII